MLTDERKAELRAMRHAAPNGGTFRVANDEELNYLNEYSNEYFASRDRAADLVAQADAILRSGPKTPNPYSVKLGY